MKFADIKNKFDLCAFFDIQPSQLDYLLSNVKLFYDSFSVKKKNGESRIINAPKPPLKNIQQKLSKSLIELYKPKKSVHAFCINRNIKTNAIRHKNSKYVLNLDLKNFFHSITYNRVLGLFKAFPFNLDREVSGILARLCCFDDRLPQGSPVSPIITNLICRALDTKFTTICEELKCQYTRYADDITISTRRKHFPTQIGIVTESDEFEVSPLLINIFKKNNFYLNKEKIRFQNFMCRQVVTGLTVNKKVNINRIYLKKVRAILNAIENFGIEKAMEQHFSLNNIPINRRNYSKSVAYFLKRVVGKISFIGFVKGQDNETYKNLFKRIKKIYPEAKLSVILKEIAESDIPIVVTEGKTDWKHLKSALRYFKSKEGKFLNLRFKFHEYDSEFEMGSASLLKLCETHSKGVLPNVNKIICVFDRDEKNILPKITKSDMRFKPWGQNVFSMVIPLPQKRETNGVREICVEHLYRDEDLTILDSHNRRLFLSNEFEVETGVHKLDKTITLSKKHLAGSPYPKIIDSGILQHNQSIALTKNNFALNVLNGIHPFDKVSFSDFEPFFNNLEQILSID
ncbi:reverse transcriptase domain-containing protein [Sphingobacterium lactis]|uniref:reverse transcriptase domain-containing protein n=1 Tax=Sphingobacterium lactis TaxID=797291 RepID=UPI003EC8CE4B